MERKVEQKMVLGEAAKNAALFEYALNWTSFICKSQKYGNEHARKKTSVDLDNHRNRSIVWSPPQIQIKKYDFCYCNVDKIYNLCTLAMTLSTRKHDVCVDPQLQACSPQFSMLFLLTYQKKGLYWKRKAREIHNGEKIQSILHITKFRTQWKNLYLKYFQVYH